MTRMLCRTYAYAILIAATLSGSVSYAQSKPRSPDEAWGGRYQLSAQARRLSTHAGPHGEDPLGRLSHWNEIAINATGLDHTPVSLGENRIFGQQFGPTRASRAMAIVHIAIFEAMNAIDGDYQSMVGLGPARSHASMDAAIAKAACDALSAMFSSQAPSFQELLAEDMTRIPDDTPKRRGIEIGRHAAELVLAMRANDGSQQVEPLYGIDYIPSSQLPDSGVRTRSALFRSHLAPTGVRLSRSFCSRHRSFAHHRRRI